MGRINYAIRLIIRLMFVVLCFVVTFLFTAILNYQTDGIKMTDSTEAPYFVLTTKNGAAAQYSVEDGMIVLDIEQSGDGYDDIVITLKTDPLEYDTTFLEKFMGDKPEYAEYIEDMKHGPWSAYIRYRLMGDSVFTTGNKSFSFRYGSDVFTDSLYSKAANTNKISDEMLVFENDEVACDIIMGTSASGALPSGRYYLFAEFNIEGLYGENNPKLSFAESVPAFLKISADALKTVKTENIFNVSSWLTFYLVMVIFGCIFFLYPDIRAAFRIATAGKSDVIKVIYCVSINGCYVGEVSEYVGNSPFSLLIFVLTYLFMLLTIPLRIIAQIINSIVRIIRGDDYDDCDPLFANIIGSVGVYAALTAVIGLIIAIVSSGSYIIVIVSGVIGAALLVVANIMSKRKEDEM